MLCCLATLARRAIICGICTFYFVFFWGEGWLEGGLGLRRRLPKGFRVIGDMGRQGEGGYPEKWEIGETSFMDGP